jgi:anti-sigma factor RsiW
LNCYQIKMLLPSYDNDELPEEERKTVKRHLASCAACRSALEAIRILHNRLALLQDTPLNTEITDSIISRLKRMTDVNAPETAADITDIGPSALSGKSETAKNDRTKENVVDLPRDAEGKLLPGWDLPGKP